jgi:DNA processing protein
MGMPLDDDVRDLLALQLTPGLGPRLTTALLERFGTARGALSAGAAELCGVPQIGDKLADKLVRAMARVNVAAE